MQLASFQRLLIVSGELASVTLNPTQFHLKNGTVVEKILPNKVLEPIDFAIVRPWGSISGNSQCESLMCRILYQMVVGLELILTMI